MSRHSMRQPRQGRNQIRCHQRLRVRGLILDLIPRQYQRGEGTRLSPCPRCPDPQDADRQPDDGAEQGPERPMKPRAWVRLTGTALASALHPLGSGARARERAVVIFPSAVEERRQADRHRHPVQCELRKPVHNRSGTSTSNGCWVVLQGELRCPRNQNTLRQSRKPTPRVNSQRRTKAA